MLPRSRGGGGGGGGGGVLHLSKRVHNFFRVEAYGRTDGGGGMVGGRDAEGTK